MQVSDIQHKQNPVKAIRAKCLDCCCNQPKEVRLCPTARCPLHPFRMGHNPFRKPNPNKGVAKAVPWLKRDDEKPA